MRRIHQVIGRCSFGLLLAGGLAACWDVSPAEPEAEAQAAPRFPTVTFAAVQGAASPEARRVELWNAPRGLPAHYSVSVSYEPDQPTGWLVPLQLRTSSHAHPQIGLSVRSSDLPAGTYTGAALLVQGRSDGRWPVGTTWPVAVTLVVAPPS